MRPTRPSQGAPPLGEDGDEQEQTYLSTGRGLSAPGTALPVAAGAGAEAGRAVSLVKNSRAGWVLLSSNPQFESFSFIYGPRLGGGRRLPSVQFSIPWWSVPFSQTLHMAYCGDKRALFGRHYSSTPPVRDRQQRISERQNAGKKEFLRDRTLAKRNRLTLPNPASPASTSSTSFVMTNAPESTCRAAAPAYRDFGGPTPPAGAALAWIQRKGSMRARAGSRQSGGGALQADLRVDAVVVVVRARSSALERKRRGAQVEEYVSQRVRGVHVERDRAEPILVHVVHRYIHWRRRPAARQRARRCRTRACHIRGCRVGHLSEQHCEQCWDHPRHIFWHRRKNASLRIRLYYDPRRTHAAAAAGAGF
jgi:hypothetical protein